MTMRVAHVTDIHWMVPPDLGNMNFKRVLGTANLYLRGRRHHFTEEVQDALVAHLLDLSPELVVITGDLTAQALQQEFTKARGALQPVLDRIPGFVIPGNHDGYTYGAQREDRIRSVFGDWMGDTDSAITRLDCGKVTCLGLNPNRPMYLRSSGCLPEEQLVALAEALHDPVLEGRFVALCIHYPVLDRRGAVYNGSNHGLLNAPALIDVLRRSPRRPDLILHGHEHHGFHVDLALDGSTGPIYNCGSSGYAYMPERQRAAAMNVYEIRNAQLSNVQRYLFDGTGFSEEPGGAYATGH